LSISAVDPTPTDGVTGNQCPAGHYCLKGVSLPTPCGPGTYSGSTHNTQASDCDMCTAGQYCPNYNMTATAGEQPSSLFVYVLSG